MTKTQVDAMVAAIAEEVRAYIDVRLKSLPEPPAGKDGAPGVPGKDADPVAIADEWEARYAVECLKPLVSEAVCRAVAAIELPPPKDGAPGKDGERGADGDRGEKGEPGRDGVDGKSVTIEDVTPMLDAMFTKALLDYERRFNEAVTKAIAAIPKPKDGVDGLSVEDLEVKHDGLGNVTVAFARGEVRRQFDLRLPCFRDRGVFRDDIKDFRAGDGVTFGGSYWIAQRDNPEGKPGDGAADGEKGKGNGHWRLAVNKGRDGRREPPPPTGGPVRV